MDAKELLMDVVKRNASDVFIVAGSPCAVKIHGKIQKYNQEKLKPEDTEHLIREIYAIANKDDIDQLLEMETMIFHFQFLELVDFV